MTADNESKFFGQPDPALDYTITSGALLGSDQPAGELTRAQGQAPGSYAISQGTFSLSANYKLTFIDGVFTIVTVNTAGSLAGVTLDISGFTVLNGILPGVPVWEEVQLYQAELSREADNPPACPPHRSCLNSPYPTNLQVTPDIAFVPAP